MDECKRCKKEIKNKKYNQIYCCDECRKEEYTEQYWERRKRDKCEICKFPYFTERHHIIKKMDWGSDEDENCVYLCKNHHSMADSIYFYEKIKELIFKKTGKIGCKLSEGEIDFLKKEIRGIILSENPITLIENIENENSFIFYLTMIQLIQRNDFYSRLKNYRREIK